MFSTVVTPSASAYPDSDKVGIWTGRATASWCGAPATSSTTTASRPVLRGARGHVDPPDEALLRAADVAAWLDVDEDWLDRAIAHDELPVMGFTSAGEPVWRRSRSGRGSAARIPTAT